MGDQFEKIKNFLESRNCPFDLKKFSKSTKTSLEAARIVGCGIEQIAKTIVFETEGKYKKDVVLVIASGKNRVDIKKVQDKIHQNVEKAEASFVKEKTGFSIGNVPPITHKNKIRTLIDEELMNRKELWTASGISNTLFKITPKKLEELTEGESLDIKED